MVQMVSLQVTSTTTQKSPEYLYGDKRRFSREFHETVTYLTTNSFLHISLSSFPHARLCVFNVLKVDYIVKGRSSL